MGKSSCWKHIVKFLQIRRFRFSLSISRDAVQRQMDIRTRTAVKNWTKQKRYCAHQSMDEISSAMGISKEQLSWYFRHRIGKNFLQWRKELRIREAQSVMQRNPVLPLARVADSVGIADKGNFRRQFREVTGMSPAEWRSREQAFHIRIHQGLYKFLRDKRPAPDQTGIADIG